MAERKTRPEPLEEPDSLEQKLERAAEREIDSDLRVALLVAGGAPSQRYRFHFAADGSGQVRSELGSELSGHKGRASRQKLAPEEFAHLIKQIVASGVLEISAEQPRFLPDTVVGSLELSDGRTTLRWDFAADPEQAKAQGAVPPSALQKAADEIYSIGGRLMGKRALSVKP